MHDPRVIVVGAGPAGMAAALALSQCGERVLVVDQAPQPGGAVHRAPLPGVAKIGLPEHRRRWERLEAQIRAQGARIEISCSTAFGGVDAKGAVLLTGAMTRLLQPRGLIFATGARERVQPRPGCTLPGVTTVGALQSHVKRLGKAPEGRVLLAGSGPLLLALAAEMTALGNPPIAVIEAARPPVLPALHLPTAYLAEAARYRLRLMRAGVPILYGARLTRIEPGLRAHVETTAGPRLFEGDLIGLHDGIRPNDTGLKGPCPIPMVMAGDCREALGARAAMIDGTRAGVALLAQLRGAPVPAEPAALIRQRRAQALLWSLYAHEAPLDLPGDTVLCRCEGRTLDDLRGLGAEPTARDLRLTGRFGMGPCQGRFCAEWVARFTGTEELGRSRLPARPLAIADLLAVPTADTGDQT